MFKKIIVTAAIVGIGLSFAGCGEGDVEDFYSVMSSVADVKNASYTGSIVLVDYGKSETMKLDYTGKMNEDGDAAIQMAITADTEDFKTSGTLDILDIVLQGNTAYLNAGKLLGSIGSLSGSDDLGMLDSVSGVNIGADWLKIESGEELDDGDLSVSVPDLNGVEDSLHTAYIPFLTTLNETLSGIEPAVIGVEGNKYFFYISEENLEAVITALDTAVSEGKFDEIVNNVAGSVVEDAVVDIEEAISEIKSETGDMSSFECRCEVYKDGDDTCISAYLDSKDSKVRIEFSLILTASATKLDISAPEDAITIEEALNNIMSSMFGSIDISGFEDVTGADLDGVFDFSGDWDWDE